MRGFLCERPARTAVFLLVALALVACEASFEDLRPNRGGAGGDVGAEVGDMADEPDASSPDGGMDAGDDVADAVADLGDAADVGDDGVADGDASEDAGMDVADEPGDIVLLEGTFEGRNGDHGEGHASIVALAGGGYELRFAADFNVSAVPGPAVVLTTRDSIGTDIDTSAGDIRVANLQSNSGPQTYTITEAGTQAQYAWVFCEPIGVEIARAELMEVDQ